MRALSVAFLLILTCTSCTRDSHIKTQESRLKQQLFQLREQIDNYTLEKEKAPQSLNDLVTAGYLKEIPVDPFTGSAKTWVVVSEDVAMSIDQKETGITDVHSGSNLTSSDGSAYSSW